MRHEELEGVIMMAMATTAIMALPAFQVEAGSVKPPEIRG